MPALLTINSRVQRAEDFSKKNLYLAIGKTQTEWDDPNNPPVPDATATEIVELAFIKKVDTIKFVIPDATGSIVFRDTKWSEVAESDIYAKQARYLYLSTTLYYDKVPIVNYRQIGIIENPVDTSGNICKDDYYPADAISSQGFLHFIDNRRVVTRDVSQYEIISVIIEF